MRTDTLTIPAADLQRGDKLGSDTVTETYRLPDCDRLFVRLVNGRRFGTVVFQPSATVTITRRDNSKRISDLAICRAYLRFLDYDPISEAALQQLILDGWIDFDELELYMWQRSDGSRPRPAGPANPRERWEHALMMMADHGFYDRHPDCLPGRIEIVAVH